MALEGFKARTYTFREEFTARDWARAYDFPAVLEGRVKREVVPDKSPSGAQGWYFNTRREKFRDPRVREAIGLCFDFEWTNANVMFDTYVRTRSFFEGSDLVASGPPSPEELALLDPFRDRLPAELLFAEPFQPPVSDKSGQDRRLLSRAAQLLKEAGSRSPRNRHEARQRRTARHRVPRQQPGAAPAHPPFIKNLKLVGIEARLRTVNSVQYQRRSDDFDFDMLTRRYSFSATPAAAIRNVFGSEAANTKGSRNLAGIADPVVDALVDKVLTAETRVRAPGGLFCFFLNHPLLQTPDSGWIDDQMVDPPEQYWRIGRYLEEAETIEEVELGVHIRFIHRPLALRQHPRGTGAVRRADGRAATATRIPRPCPGVHRSGDRAAPAVSSAAAVRPADPIPPRGPAHRAPQRAVFWLS